MSLIIKFITGDRDTGNFHHAKSIMLRAEQMPDAFQRACLIFKLVMSLCVSRQLLAHFKSVTIALQGVGVDIVSGSL